MAGGAQERIPFNSEVFRWARNRVHGDIKEIARRINVSPDRLAEWESGDRSPTVKQARRLADIYDRPFLEFFSKEIPHVPPTELVPDFRFHSGGTPGQELAALEEVQRWAEEQRLNALDLLEIIGDEPPKFPSDLYSSVNDDVESIAEKVRDTIKFSVERQLSIRSDQRDQFPNFLRRKFEEIGVLVLRMNGITRLRTRGICLFAEPLPIIVYGGEAPSAQAFTLSHELAHILLRQSAISGPPRFGGAKGLKQIEAWCNRFAAAFLMPKKAIEKEMGGLKAPMDEIGEKELRSMANRYAVSRHAMLIRLVALGFVKPAFYWFVKRPEFIKEEEEYVGGGRPKYYGQRYRSSRGDFYTGLVIEAWNSGRITNHNAAEFMGIKSLSHLYDIRNHFGD
ncbi:MULTISPECIES: XRE family transcriptional regulator [unclassified Mesorhizobium]|uniref:XRE family transcriptional regulator n=1 Tax=unclassified Mesorhizobium TaxID=325217 RepID=UPI00143F7A20|nr:MULTISPECIES: XRE family transcriptional regulator [unclassified Mesorhizobium]